MQHKCGVYWCKRLIPAVSFFCGRHQSMVPRTLMTHVYQQCWRATGDNTPVTEQAQKLLRYAVRAVNKEEGWKDVQDSLPELGL